jgi:hypothetical protein
MEVDNFFQVVEMAQNLRQGQSFVFMFNGCDFIIVHDEQHDNYCIISKSTGIRSYIRTRSNLNSDLIRDAINKIAIEEVHNS